MKFPIIYSLVFLLALVFAVPFAWGEDPPPIEQRRHPDYTILGLDDLVNPQTPLNPNFVISPEARIAEASIWRSSYIPERLVGLDVGDVDKDGKNEMVYLTLHNVYLYRFDNGEYTQLANFSLPKNARGIAIDLYDTNGDAKKEILVSAENDDNHSANSLVLSYTGDRTLTALGTSLPYYLRVVGQEGSRVMVAQRSGTSPGSSFDGPVHYASFENGRISLSAIFELPFQVNIYNFNVGELGRERMRLTTIIKFPTEHLLLTEFSGEKVWESHDEYGGAINYIELTPYGDSSRSVEYIPTRIIIADIDQDGSNELIVAKNNQSGTRVFRNLRTFNSGIIEARKFVNLSLIPFFTSSNLLPGAAVDYQLADFDNNGSKDLIVGILIEPGSGMLQDARSIIFSYNNLYNVEPTATPASTSDE